MLNLQQISKGFQQQKIQNKKQVELILSQLQQQFVVCESPIVIQLLKTLNQLQLMLSIQMNQSLRFLVKSGQVTKFQSNSAAIEQVIEDEYEKKQMIDKIQYLDFLEVRIDSSGAKQMQLTINEYVIERVNQTSEKPEIDQLLTQHLRNQDTLTQLLIKIYCILLVIQWEFNNTINETIKSLNLDLNEIEVKQETFKERVIMTNLDLIYKSTKYQPKKEEKNIHPQNHRLFLYQQTENNLITRAFELLDNTMYGKRKRSFEKDKESAYQNFSQRVLPEMPMDIFRVDPYMSYQAQALFSQVAPPQNSPALTHVSTLSQYNSLCLSPSNSDSHSIASQRLGTFKDYKIMPNLIDQNQYAQISQQNIDAQIRQRKLLNNQQQNQRVSRSKSNSTVMPDIFKEIGLKDEKVDEKQKQKVSKRTQNPKKQVKQPIK